MHKALFLDRDGTINIDYGYVYQPEKFHFIDGIFDLCQTAQQSGYLIIVITNQSGISRGYFTEQDFQKINTHMINEFRKNNIHITDVFYCPDLIGPNRKPNTGMFLSAQKKHCIDMSQSICIGDKEQDILAGRNAGCGKNLLFQDNFQQIKEAL